ncbi:MAG: DUF4249 domain-containing protein [Dysgonamonadaceae bacterium]|jgi:hypothetical protein|nr:DUF4249 domain-containing protein [Dysgonamonadaceae bacterium]
MKKYGILLAGLISCFSACEKEIEFKGGETEPQLVLNSILTPDSAIRVHLSESRFFLADKAEFKNIRNAAVTLLKNGEVIETFRDAGEGYYVADYRPKTGDRLQITASASGLEPVECSAEILPAPTVLSADMVKLSTDNDYDLTVSLKDPSETSDYYRIDMYVMVYDGKSGYYYPGDVLYDSDDMVFGSAGLDPFGAGNNYYYVFSDELFNGKEYKLKLRLYHLINDQEGKTKLFIELQHITKDYYLYLKSRNVALGDEIGLFTEPVQIYNNIQGGIGILGSYTSTVYELPLNGIE